MESAPSLDAPSPTPAPLAGFLRRLFAFGLDYAVLALAAHALGRWVGEEIAPAGGPGRLLGLALAVPYVALFGSRLGNGQTFGKRLCGIRVVDAEGRPLSPLRSAARALALYLPFLANGIGLVDASPLGLAATALIAAVVLGLGGAITVTFLFNKHTQQATHDLLVGSLVVLRDGRGPFRLDRARWPAVLSVSLVGGVAAVGGIGAAIVPSLVPVPDLVRALDGIPETRMIGFKHQTNHVSAAGGEARSYESVRIVLGHRGPPAEASKVAMQAAAVVLERYPGAESLTLLEIGVTSGWDLGFADGLTSASWVLPPAEWRAGLAR